MEIRYWPQPSQEGGLLHRHAGAQEHNYDTAPCTTSAVTLNL